MILSRIKLAGIVLILLVAGCIEKDELTLPVRVRLKIAISSKSETEDFYFPRGYIGVKSIRFEGKRESGEDVFFETNPKINLQKLEFSADPAIISDFDIPKGIYNYMKWDITLKRIGWTEEFIDAVITGSPDIGLLFSGLYEYLNEYYIPLRFAVDETVQLSLRSLNPDGNSRIVLSDNKVHEAILLLDPEYAFSPVDRKSIREAEISIDNSEHPIIIISSNKNKDLYKNLLQTISLYTRVVVY